MSRVPSYYATPTRLKTPEQMQALLAERTKRNQATAVPADTVAPGPMPRGTLLNSLGGGDRGSSIRQSAASTAEVPVSNPVPVTALIWLAPVKDSLTGHYTVKDTLGAYTVIAERTSGGKGWQYLAFKGSTVLAPVCSTAECAKAHCQSDADKSP